MLEFSLLIGDAKKQGHKALECGYEEVLMEKPSAVPQ
jgi:hypothetical protein